MLKDITLGQFFPGNSPIHRLDPRTKLIVMVIYIVALFLAQSWISYGVMFVFLACVIRTSTIPLKSILRGMKPLIMILVFTGVLNLFFTREGRVLVEWGEHCDYRGRCKTRHSHGSQNPDADYLHLPVDLYHFSHCAYGRTGIPDGSPEKNWCPGA